MLIEVHTEVFSTKFFYAQDVNKNYSMVKEFCEILYTICVRLNLGTHSDFFNFTCPEAATTVSIIRLPLSGLSA